MSLTACGDETASDETTGQDENVEIEASEDPDATEEGSDIQSTVDPGDAEEDQMPTFEYSVMIVKMSDGTTQIRIGNVTQWPMEDEIDIIFEPYMIVTMADRGDGNAAVFVSENDGTGSYNAMGELRHEYDASTQTLTAYADASTDIDWDSVSTYDCYIMRDGSTASYQSMAALDITFNESEVASAGSGSNLGSGLSALVPEEFPINEWDEELWVREAQRSEEDYFIVMSTVYWADYYMTYDDGRTSETATTFLGLTPTINQSDWTHPVSTTKTYEVKQVWWCYWNEDGDLVYNMKTVADNAILEYMFQDWGGDPVIKDGVAYPDGMVNPQVSPEDYAGDFGNGLGLVEYSDCIVYYSK